MWQLFIMKLQKSLRSRLSALLVTCGLFSVMADYMSANRSEAVARLQRCAEDLLDAVKISLLKSLVVVKSLKAQPVQVQSLRMFLIERDNLQVESAGQK